MKTKSYHILTEHGIKPSVQRLAVLNFLLQSKEHPHADEIFAALSPLMPTLSKTTIYTTLKLLADKGAILMLNHDDKGVRYDGCTKPHAHFYCNCCQNLYDLPFDTAFNRPIVCEHYIQEVQLMYKGICQKCNNNQK